MGVESFFRAPNRGGVSLFMLHLSYIWVLPFVLRLSCFLLHRGRFSANQGKTGQKLDFLWCAFVFSRYFRRPKTAKFKIYLSFECCRGFCVALSLGRWSCPLVQAFGASGPAESWPWSFCGAFPAFCPLPAFALLQYLLNMPYFAF